MNRMYVTIAAGLLAAGVAAAQEEHSVVMAPQIKVLSLQGGVMGKTVKGAPYSGVEVNETTQTLADGTRIHNETQTQVFRDSEGRMRRETPNEVTIWDPVANASWVLHPSEQTARKLPMGTFYFSTKTDTSKAGAMAKTETMTYSFRVKGDGPDPAADAEKKMVEAKLKAEVENNVRTSVGSGVGYGVGGGVSGGVGGGVAVAMRKATVEAGRTESLGKRMIEGLNSDGTRNVVTVEAGAIGNDRPIQSTTERWFSPDLQTVMLTKHSDPRTGEESFKLTNVSRSEPPPYLFQVPAGYTVVEQK
jgi:hypothetical protein